MKLLLTSKNPNTHYFVSLFQVLKACSTHISLQFEESRLYIQGMDRSHVCLFDISLSKEWFSEYDKPGTDLAVVGLTTNIFATLLSSKQAEHDIEIHYEGEPDTLEIDLLQSKDKGVNTYYKLPMIDIQTDLLDIPEVEYDAEFVISSTKMTDILGKLALFGESVRFTCKDESIAMTSQGENGEITMDIHIDYLKEYSIFEGEEIEVTYSLNYLNKMLVTSKLTDMIGIYISKDSPMKVVYDLGKESRMLFYLAPKIDDN